MVRDGGRNGHLCGNLSFFEAIAPFNQLKVKILRLTYLLMHQQNMLARYDKSDLSWVARKSLEMYISLK